MESEIVSSRIHLYTKDVPGGRDEPSYLKSVPGVLRASNVFLALLSLVLVLLGFPDEYSFSEDDEIQNHHVLIPDRYERKRKPWLRLTPDGKFASFESYYGAGYSTERANVLQLICIVICLVSSALYLLFLVIYADCHHGTKRRGWNRFINLSLAIIQFIGFLNGTFGLLLFRSYCCHVQFAGNERHKSELEGYFREPCLCFITPSTYYDRQMVIDDNEYTTLYYHDVPDDVIFQSALPHHFIPHAISLVLMGINTILHLFSSIRI